MKRLTQPRPRAHGRKQCDGPHCRQTVGGRHRFCRFHWRLLPTDTRLALSEAFATQAWHVFAQVAQEAAEWLRVQDAARIAAAQQAIARAIGDTAD